MPASTVPLVEVGVVARRVIAARVRDPHLVEDLTQETLTRIAAVADHLDGDALRAYTIVTARNLIASHARNAAVEARHQHRLVEFRSLDGPEPATLEREETDALAAALARLDDGDRRLLLRHETDGDPVDTLAADSGTSRGAVKMRLARARATLRVEFVCALRRVDLPTSHCRPVLLALSSGEARAQHRVDAANHLLICPTCADLARPVVERKRGLAGWLIIPLTDATFRTIGLIRGNHLIHGVTAMTAVAATAGIVYAVTTSPGPDTAAPAAPTAAVAPDVAATTVAPATTTASSAAVIADTAPSSTTSPVAPCPPGVPLGQTAPATIIGCGFAPSVVTPLDVAADEGFWAATASGEPVWVQLAGAGESPLAVVAGQPVTIAGTITPTPPDPTSMGVPPGTDPRLTAAGFYLSVAYSDIGPA